MLRALQFPSFRALTLAALFGACGSGPGAPGHLVPTDSPGPPPTPPPPPIARDFADTVLVAPGTDIQAMVDAHAPGTVFLLGGGVHRQQSVVPKDRMAFIGQPGAVLDGEGVAAVAFRGDFKHRVVNGVLIRGLEIRNYASRLQSGAIRAGGPWEETDRWSVEDVDVHHNDGGGIRIGHRMVVRDSRIHHNGQIGIVGQGDDVIVERNEIAFNNTRDVRRTVGLVEFGGTKFVATRNLVVRDNYVHDNHEQGVWLDVNNVNSLIENNRVIDNSADGIMIEISYGAVVRNNYVAGNGFGRPGNWLYGAGIFISSSSDVEVYGNTVIDNFRGVTAVEQDRGSGPLGPRIVRNLYVHDNTIGMQEGWTGIGQDVGDTAVFTTRNNRFERNTYQLGPNEKYFAWMNDKRSETEWREFGLDVAGEFQR